MAQLKSYDICASIKMNSHTQNVKTPVLPIVPAVSSDITIPIKPQHYDEDGPPFQAHIFLRSPDCELLCHDSSCSKCSMQEKLVHKPKEKSHVQPPEPVKDKAPLLRSSKERLVATVQT